MEARGIDRLEGASLDGIRFRLLNASQADLTAMAWWRNHYPIGAARNGLAGLPASLLAIYEAVREHAGTDFVVSPTRAGTIVEPCLFDLNPPGFLREVVETLLDMRRDVLETVRLVPYREIRIHVRLLDVAQGLGWLAAWWATPDHEEAARTASLIVDAQRRLALAEPGCGALLEGGYAQPATDPTKTSLWRLRSWREADVPEAGSMKVLDDVLVWLGVPLPMGVETHVAMSARSNLPAMIMASEAGVRDACSIRLIEDAIEGRPWNPLRLAEDDELRSTLLWAGLAIMASDPALGDRHEGYLDTFAQTLRERRARFLEASRNRPGYAEARRGLEAVMTIDSSAGIPAAPPPPAEAPPLAGRPTGTSAEPSLSALTRRVARGIETSSPHHALNEEMPLLAWPDPDLVAGHLEREFPWAGPVTSEIRRTLSMVTRLSGASAVRMPPVCIVGDPGTGKSRLVRRLMQIVHESGGPGGGTMNLAGVTDNRILSGTARGWSGSRASYPSTIMLREGCANPILHLDEADKPGGRRDSGGHVHDSLVSMLDPEMSPRFLDEGVGTEVDISGITWILTANDRHGINPLVCARLKFLRMPRPRPEDFDVLVAAMREDLAREFGSTGERLPPIEDEVLSVLRHEFRERGMGARVLSRLVRSAVLSQEPPEYRTKH